MQTSTALINWFDDQLDSLSGNSLSTEQIQQLLVDPPIGITHLKLKHKSVTLHRSGPKGWTYFPADAKGTRLARISYTSKLPGVYVSAFVKLDQVTTTDDTESYKVFEDTILTVDNLNSHGQVERRRTGPVKKRKISIIH